MGLVCFIKQHDKIVRNLNSIDNEEYLRNYDEDDYYDYYYENEPFLPSNNSDDDEYNSDENYRY